VVPRDKIGAFARRRRMFRRVAGIILGLAQICAAPPASGGHAAMLDYTRPGRLVALPDGRRLNMRCTGAGPTTVVLDAGGAGFSLDWRKVQGEIARFARVCSYDRAGYGFSDPNTRPATAMNIVDDLHQALMAADIRAPLVLVGHSAGGLYTTLYADLYPSEVAGLVLVDPGFASSNHDNAAEAWSAYPELLAEQRAQQAAHRKLMQACVALARSGGLKRDLGECACMSAPEDLPELASYVLQYCSSPKQFEGMLAEEAALVGTIGDTTSISDDQEAAAARPFGAMPVTVLTNGRGWTYTKSADLNARLTMVWRAGHVALAGRSDRGKVVLVQHSGHSIALDQPHAVIDAVLDLIRELALSSR
jgi:pimeloyl-ACP methyl ester carboxylesterase